MKIVAVGDILATRPIGPIDSALALVFNDAVSIGNLETTTGLPHAPSGVGIKLFARPGIGVDLRAIGFDALSLANNHACDFGAEGLRATISEIVEAGIAPVGAGESLADARAYRLFEIGGERIAVLAASLTMPPGTTALNSVGIFSARPGINGIRTRVRYSIGKDALEALREIASSVGRLSSSGPEQIEAFDCEFHLGVEARFDIEASETDKVALLDEIASAREQADFVVVSLHSHLSAGHPSTTPQFLRRFSQDLVDGGADFIFGHGPHCIRGVEFHHGGIICYSLGNFVFQLSLLESLTSEMLDQFGGSGPLTMSDLLEDINRRNGGGFDLPFFWEGLICEIGGRRGRPSVLLHPIELERNRKHDIGLPRLASPGGYAKIAADLLYLSRPLGTRIVKEGSILRAFPE